MKMFGVALLPDNIVMQKVVEFQHEHHSYLDGPILGIKHNLPHTSVLQCPFRDFELTPQRLHEISNIWHRTLHENRPSGHLGNLYYQPKGWIFINIHTGEWIRQFHDKTFAYMKMFIDRSTIPPKKDYSGYTNAERQNYKRFGYRYIRESFRPHITLGRTNVATPEHVSSVLVNDFNSQLSGTVFSFEHIAFYQAGEYGAAEKILAISD